MKLTLLIIWCVFFYISILFLFLNEWIIKLTFIPFPLHTITEANNVRWAWFSRTIGDLTVPRTSQSFPTIEKIKDIPHCLGWSATSPQTWEYFLLSRRGNNSLTSRIETRHSRLKKNPTNHGGASCFIRRSETSRPHRLMKTSSVQSKRHESHYKWPHRETNDNALLLFMRVASRVNSSADRFQTHTEGEFFHLLGFRVWENDQALVFLS